MQGVTTYKLEDFDLSKLYPTTRRYLNEQITYKKPIVLIIGKSKKCSCGRVIYTATKCRLCKQKEYKENRKEVNV